MAWEISKARPFDLVIVEHKNEDSELGQYSHVGQVISRPIENRTIMVRLVPDDPCTMVELPLSAIKPTSTKYKWVHYAKVSGSFSFPVDMLRYDCAAPVSFNLVDNGRGYEPMMKEGMEDMGLVIARCTERKDPQWTDGRWASFSWRLERMKILKIEGK